MPLWCRFNKPDDETSKEEYVQYIYAMQLWKLQDELDLSFEMASMYLDIYRSHVPEHILRYRSDVDVDDREQLRSAEADLWAEYNSMDLHITEWIVKNCKRFQGMTCFHETYEEHLPGDYTEPEFNFYV